MKVDGACHCGAIAFAAEIDPAMVRLCHCTDCQVLSGGPYTMIAATLPGTFRITRGSLKIYVKTAESGRKRAHGLCETCGTRIYSAPVGDEVSSYNLRATTLAQRKDLRPRQQIWSRSALPWVEDLHGIEKIEKQ